MRPSPSSRRPRAAAALIAAAACSAALAGPALAGSYEQVTRASGAQGWAPFTYTYRPVAVSDSGRFATYHAGPSALGSIASWTRDIVTNTRRKITTGDALVLQLTADDQTALIFKNVGGHIAYALRPVGGGPDKLVYVTTDDDNAIDSTAAVSGDGKTVAIATAVLRVITVATGATKTYPISNPRVNERTLSDDGTVLAGGRLFGGGFRIVRGKLTELDFPAGVSPNGKVIVSQGSTQGPGGNVDQLVAYRVSNGAQKAFTYDPGVSGFLSWISPDGSRAAVSNSGSSQISFATGKWSAFGGALAAQVDGDLTGFNPEHSGAISRSGRYALIGYGNGLNNQGAIVDLTGGDLPGAQEPLSASSYLTVRTPIATGPCDQEYGMTVLFLRPAPWAPWAPLPRRASLVVTIDGEETFRQSFDRAFDRSDPASGFPELVRVPFHGDDEKIVLSATVVDDRGRTLTTEETTKPYCPGGFS